MIWVLLEVLQVIKASHFFHNDGELVLSVLVEEVLLSTGENIIESLEGDCQHPDVVDFEHASESLDHTFLDKYFKLTWVCAGCAVAQGPDCLVFDLYVVMLKNLNKLVHNANINTDLNLIFGTCSDIRKDPA